MIEGQTNVRSIRLGPGSARRIGAELGRFAVTTMDLPWQLARGLLGADPECVVMVDSMELDVVERQAAGIPTVDAVVAVGGGQAIDLGKYVAWRRGFRLVTIPTILSVDAFVTPAAAVREGHRVKYVGAASPDPLVIDYDLIRTAPRDLNVAGAGDLLSIHTACFDWEIAERAGRSEYRFAPADVATARAVLAAILDGADTIRRCTDDGLRLLVEGYMRINTICLPAGHYRVEEGSEHYLFYALEEQLGRAFVHGNIVGLGIYLMSRLQHNSPEIITACMDRIGLQYQPANLGISRPELASALSGLRSYIETRPDLWYTIIDEREIEPEWIDETLAPLRFSVR